MTYDGNDVVFLVQIPRRTISLLDRNEVRPIDLRVCTVHCHCPSDHLPTSSPSANAVPTTASQTRFPALRARPRPGACPRLPVSRRSRGGSAPSQTHAGTAASGAQARAAGAPARAHASTAAAACGSARCTAARRTRRGLSAGA